MHYCIVSLLHSCPSLCVWRKIATRHPSKWLNTKTHDFCDLNTCRDKTKTSVFALSWKFFWKSLYKKIRLDLVNVRGIYYKNGISLFCFNPRYLLLLALRFVMNVHLCVLFVCAYVCILWPRFRESNPQILGFFSSLSFVENCPERHPDLSRPPCTVHNSTL